MHGNWDKRISRRTLLRTGGAAAIVLYGGAVPSASAGGRFPELPLHPGRRLRRADAGRGRAVDAAGSGPAQRRRARRPRATLVRFEVAARPGVPCASCTAATRGGPGGGAHGPCRGQGTASPSATYWYRFECKRHVEPGRAALRTAPRLRHASPDHLRFAYVSCQNYTHGLFPAFDGPRAAGGHRARRASRRLHLRGPGPGRRSAPARAGRPTLMTLADYRDAARPVQDGPVAPGCARRVPVADDLGRPRVLEQLRRSRHRQPRRCRSRPSPSGAPPRTSPTGSTARSRARASRSITDMPCTGAPRGAASRSSTCSTRASPLQPVACSPAQRSAERLLPEALDPARDDPRRRAARLADRRPRRARRPAGTCSPTRSRFAPTDTGRPRPARSAHDNWDGYVADRQRVLDAIKEAQAFEPDRDHRRRARARSAQRAAGLRELRRPAGGDGVHRHVDQHATWAPRTPSTDPRRFQRPEQPAPAVPDTTSAATSRVEVTPAEVDQASTSVIDALREDDVPPSSRPPRSRSRTGRRARSG